VEERLSNALRAACHALRSYQYGNGVTELAEEVADHIDSLLKEAPTMIKPTIGRVVWFWNGKSGQEQPQAALIAWVHSDTLVNLAVFDAEGATSAVTSVLLWQAGDDNPVGPYCEWMPYQLGQALKELHPVIERTFP
jgi:hypothetical protein